MVIRLVQSFKNFRLAMEDHPESLPPPEWKILGVGRKAVENVNVKSHLTIYAKVRVHGIPRLCSESYRYFSRGGSG
jgi:hypothetical protein